VSAALWKVGQLRPHQTLVFRRITLSEAIALRLALERAASASCLSAVETPESARP
jgi:hypothetical protein